MTCRIVGATLRDLSYIASNLRPDDKAEIDCQLDEWTPAALALSAMQGFAYIAELDGNPEAAFGAAENRSGLWTAWSWGSKRMWRCVPRITKFFYEVLGPDVAAQGAWRVEARALAANDMALRWLKRLGATERCHLPAYGKNGEDFILFDWTRETWANVHFRPEAVSRPDPLQVAQAAPVAASVDQGGRPGEIRAEIDA